MKIKLPNSPKGLKGTLFTRLLSIEMNDFSVEMLLPSLFFLIESKGRKRKKKTDPTTIEEYLNSMLCNSNFVGFDGVDGKRIFEKWAKTSLMEIGKKGLKKTIDQILYLQPLTYMTLKPGFPSETSRLRNVHYFIYTLLLESLIKQYSDDKKALLVIRKALRDSFAEGVNGLPEIDAGTAIDGTHDKTTNLDTETLFSLYFMDVFPKAEISINKVDAEPPVCIGQAKRFMQGFVKFIIAYKDKMPARELIYNLEALINFELFIYTLKLTYGTNQLVRTNELPEQFNNDEGNTPPYLYVDFADSRKSLSREIARQCTTRDIQEISQFFNSNLLLRTLEFIISSNPRFKDVFDGREPADYLQTLLEHKDDKYVEASANLMIDSIKQMNLEGINELDESNIILQKYFDNCDSLYINSVDRLVAILDQSQRSSGGQKFLRWNRDVSGVTKDFGIIKGSVRHRSTWAYVMSNDLLWALVHLAAINPEDSKSDKPKRLRLIDFLKFLKNRYGILVKEVPEGLESIDSNRAARENLFWLQKKLKQMGLFENLSDDYEAQYITPQYRTKKMNHTSIEGKHAL